MATGDLIVSLYPTEALLVESAAASHDLIDDGSTIAGFVPVLDFAGATANEHAEWEFVVPDQYGGGGFDVKALYAMDGTVGGDIQLEVRMKALGSGDTVTSHDLQTQTATDITDTPNGTANVTDLTPVGAVTHANAASPAVGETVRIRISRDYNHASNADDLQLIQVIVTET